MKSYTRRNRVFGCDNILQAPLHCRQTAAATERDSVALSVALAHVGQHEAEYELELLELAAIPSVSANPDRLQFCDVTYLAMQITTHASPGVPASQAPFGAE